MRLCLSLQVIGKNNILPLNYQYELSSWIYKTLNFGDSDFSDWLHRKGFVSDRKQFKLFTFSNLKVEHKTIDGDRLILNDKKASLVISFFPIELFEPFVVGLFKERLFGLGDKRSVVDFAVTQVEKLPEPIFTNNMEFVSISPIHIAWRDEQQRIDHIAPNHPEYERLFFGNLYSKYEAYQLFQDKTVECFNLEDCKLTLTNIPKRKAITIKSNTAQQTKLIAYSYNFHIQAPVPLVRIGYFSSFGKAGSQGFGCCEVKR